MYYVSSDLLSRGSPDSFRYLSHHGVLGQKWGVRRYQNADGTRTAAGKKRMEASTQNFHTREKKVGNGSVTIEKGRKVSTNESTVSSRTEHKSQQSIFPSIEMQRRGQSSSIIPLKRYSLVEDILGYDERHAMEDSSYWIKDYETKISDAKKQYEAATAKFNGYREQMKAVQAQTGKEYLAPGGYMTSTYKNTGDELYDAALAARNEATDLYDEIYTLEEEYGRLIVWHKEDTLAYAKTPLAKIEKIKTCISKGISFVKSLLKKSK